MNKKILPFILVFLSSIMVFGQGFKIVGTELRDANGNNFIMKGLNVPLAWYPTQTNNNIAAIGEVTGANCLRIVVETGTSDLIWQTAVEKCIASQMIPMVELHSVTGNNDTARLHDMAEWWASKASFLTRPDIARYILINIANEWSDWFLASPNHSPSSSLWRDGYIKSIQTIRNAGITTTLVVDAPGYGQDSKANVLLKYGLEVLAGDPEKNILFSVHMYCEWAKNGSSSVENDLPAIKAAGLPIIVGEFGFQHATDGSCDIDEQLIMNTAQLHSIGWLAWSWIGNSGGVEYLDMAVTWDGSTLTSWGETVVNGVNGTKTAVTASVFGSSSNIYPTVSITSPTDDATFESAAPVTISASAEDTDGTISKVDFYNGNTLLFSDADAPYSYTWIGAPDGTYTIIAMAYDNENGVGISAPVDIRVGEEPVVENLLTNGEFDNGTTGWVVQNTGDANGTMSVVTDAGMSGGNALKVCSTNPGTENWHIQLSQNAPFISGKKYQISFMAKAESNRAMGLAIQQEGDPWTSHYGQTMDLTTSNQTFTFTFEPTITDETAKLKFLTGLSNSCVYIDNVVFNVVQNVTNTIDPFINHSEINVYPNPFENSFKLISNEKNSEKATLTLMDVNGRILSEYEVFNYNQDIKLPDTVPSGIYMLLIRRGDHQSVVRVEKK